MSCLPGRRGKTLENRLMQRKDELNPPHMSGDPADNALDRHKAVELDPESFADRRPLDEFDFAAVPRSIEDPDPKSVRSRAADIRLRLEQQPTGPAGLPWIRSVGIHGIGSTRKTRGNRSGRRAPGRSASLGLRCPGPKQAARRGESRLLPHGHPDRAIRLTIPGKDSSHRGSE